MKFRLSRHLLVGFAVAVLVALLVLPVSAGGFTHGIVINVDGDDYYLAGAPDGPDGAFDVPGHYWVQAGPNKIVGKHYNTGPFGAPQWWSSDAPDGEFLFKVDGIIDTWTPEKAERYAARGYVHYHELVRVSDGSLHPMKVVWFKHIARTSFTLDGGPHPPDPGIEITPGVAYNFLPNWFNPYNP
jgi:selenium-binding protein 1